SARPALHSASLSSTPASGDGSGFMEVQAQTRAAPNNMPARGSQRSTTIPTPSISPLRGRAGVTPSSVQILPRDLLAEEHLDRVPGPPLGPGRGGRARRPWRGRRGGPPPPGLG